MTTPEGQDVCTFAWLYGDGSSASGVLLTSKVCGYVYVCVCICVVLYIVIHADTHTPNLPNAHP